MTLLKQCEVFNQTDKENLKGLFNDIIDTLLQVLLKKCTIHCIIQHKSLFIMEIILKFIVYSVNIKCVFNKTR